MIQHPPTMIIRQLLIDQVAASLPSMNLPWPCYVSLLPEDPPEAIALYDMIGGLERKSLVDGEHPEHFGVQVQTRAMQYLDCWRKDRRIAFLFDEYVKMTPVVVQGTTYVLQNVQRITNSVASYEVKERRAAIFAFNCRITLHVQD